MGRSISVGLMVTTLLAGTAVPAAAGTARQDEALEARTIESPTKRISCYAVQDSDAIHCRGPAYARDGDKAVELARHGKARGITLPDYPGYSDTPRVLAYGGTWRRPGIECELQRSGMTCRNLDGHGFHIRTGRFRSF